MQQRRDLRSPAIALWIVVAAACGHKANPEPEKLALGGVAELFGPIAGVRMQTPLDEAARLLPTFERTNDNDLPHLVTSNPATGKFSLAFIDGKLDLVVVDLPSRTLQEVAAAWGPGRPAGDSRALYVNQAQAVRAVVVGKRDRITVLFTPMIPLERLLGDGPKVMVSGVPILGRPATEVDAAVQAAHYTVKIEGNEHYVRSIPDTEWSDDARFDLRADAHGKIVAVMIHIDLNYPGSDAALLAALDKKFGAHTAGERGVSLYTMEGKQVGVHIDKQLGLDYPDAWWEILP